MSTLANFTYKMYHNEIMTTKGLRSKVIIYVLSKKKYIHAFTYLTNQFKGDDSDEDQKKIDNINNIMVVQWFNYFPNRVESYIPRKLKSCFSEDDQELPEE